MKVVRVNPGVFQLENYVVNSVMKFCRIFGLCCVNVGYKSSPNFKWMLYSVVLLVFYTSGSFYALWSEYILTGKLKNDSKIVLLSEEILVVITEVIRIGSGVANCQKICLILNRFMKNTGKYQRFNAKYILTSEYATIVVIIIIRLAISAVMFPDKNIWMQIVLCSADFLKLCGTLQIFNVIYLLEEKMVFVNIRLNELAKKVLEFKYVCFKLLHIFSYLGKFEFE